MDMEKTGNYIKEKRNLKGWNQDELAEIIGVSTKTISNWERGVGSIKPDNMNTLAKTLDVSLEELFYGKDHEGISREEKAEFDHWILKYATDLDDRTILSLDIAIAAFGTSLFSIAFALWALFGNNIFVLIACLPLFILGIVFFVKRRKIIAILSNKLNERKEKISMS